MSKSKIPLSLDSVPFTSKPKGSEIGEVSNRLGDSTVAVSTDELPDIIKKIGEQGYSFCTATFTNGRRSKKNFLRQQLFVLDFDNDKKILTPQQALDRAKKYNIPVLCMYETFSSTNELPRFRIIFLLDTPITDLQLATEISMMLGIFFPEADSSCYKDCSKMYFGGKSIIYLNNVSTAAIEIDHLFREFDIYIRETAGPKHYREKQRRVFKNGTPNVTVIEASEHNANVCCDNKAKNGDRPPIILASNIIRNGRKSPFYEITYKNIRPCSLTTNRTDSVVTKRNYHKKYRSNVLLELPIKCRLCHDFVNGSRELSHDEQFGIASNVVKIEGGISWFLKICNRYPHLHSHADPVAYWNSQIRGISKDYRPYSCEGFCPYCTTCSNGKNILTTVAPKPGLVEPIPGYTLDLRPLEEVQKVTYKAIARACESKDFRIYVINSMTSIGKTHCYLLIMQSGGRYLIAVPTNKLKKQVYEDAKRLGINVMMTPSLDEIKDDIPAKIWKHIERLRKNGKHEAISPYIHRILEKQDIPCLREYLDAKAKLKNFNGSVITTHRYLLVADHDTLANYDSIIVDEDILFKAVVTNHMEVSVSQLVKLASENTDRALRKKIGSILKLFKVNKSQYVSLPSIDWADDEEVHKFDAAAFCHAEHFFLRCAADDPGVKQNTVVFLDPPTFHNDLKYVIVSATANESLYRSFFGDDRVDFTMCPRAPYRGKLEQYTGYSMSRTCLNQHPGIVQSLQKYHNVADSHTITYKSQEVGDYHYGNTEGINKLEGEDILIIGSAYQPTFVYILAAAALGLEIPSNTSMQKRLCKHNGCRFMFTTFDDPDLQTVQFWMIESELEQAVGRARLLRHDCTVYLYSNFPLLQAILMDGYLVYGDFTLKSVC